MDTDIQYEFKRTIFSKIILFHSMSDQNHRSECRCSKCPPYTMLALRTIRNHYRLYGPCENSLLDSANNSSIATQHVRNTSRGNSNGDIQFSHIGMTLKK